PRTWREVLRMYTQAGRGLAAAHAAGLVHRDFKPDNVLIGADGRVRVTDFGLARPVSMTAPAERPLTGEEPTAPGTKTRIPLNTPITRAGVVVGTPAYMAPEQLRGKGADARTDQFSFCAALYEGLYGERPFSGATVGDLVKA